MSFYSLSEFRLKNAFKFITVLAAVFLDFIPFSEVNKNCGLDYIIVTLTENANLTPILFLDIVQNLDTAVLANLSMNSRLLNDNVKCLLQN